MVSWGNRTAEHVFHGRNSKEARRLPVELWKVARRKLDFLHAAADFRDLQIPGHDFEALKGWSSIRINQGWRVFFRFEAGRAHAVTVSNHL